jgi:hypothetical protein
MGMRSLITQLRFNVPRSTLRLERVRGPPHVKHVHTALSERGDMKLGAGGEVAVPAHLLDTMRR